MALTPQECTVPNMPLSKVPPVRQLCELLGIGNASLKDSTVFMDATHSWRKSSATSDGSSVATLLDWNSDSVQKELRSTALKFVQDNGNRFWSPTRSWAQPLDLHYPENKDRIIDLLVQLFWKQNRYLRNNSYYSNKATYSHTRGGSTDQPTPERESHEQSGVFTRPIRVATASTVTAEGGKQMEDVAYSRKRKRVQTEYSAQNPKRRKPRVTLGPSIVSKPLSQPSIPVPCPRIQIPFWIITWKPIYTQELWNDGKFQGLSLEDFLEGITKVTQQSHIEKIKLTLQTPFCNTILTIHSDAENVWTMAQAVFAEKLKDSRTEARERRVDNSGGHKILIEPFYEHVIMTGGSTEADDHHDAFDY